MLVEIVVVVVVVNNHVGVRKFLNRKRNSVCARVGVSNGTKKCVCTCGSWLERS